MAKRIKKPPSVVTQGYNPIGNLGSWGHAKKTGTKKLVPGRAPTKLAKTKSVKAPLVKAGSSVKRNSTEMAHRASYRRNRDE